MRARRRTLRFTTSRGAAVRMLDPDDGAEVVRLIAAAPTTTVQSGQPPPSALDWSRTEHGVLLAAVDHAAAPASKSTRGGSPRP